MQTFSVTCARTTRLFHSPAMLTSKLKPRRALHGSLQRSSTQSSRQTASWSPQQPTAVEDMALGRLTSGRCTTQARQAVPVRGQVLVRLLRVPGRHPVAQPGRAGAAPLEPAVRHLHDGRHPVREGAASGCARQLTNTVRRCELNTQHLRCCLQRRMQPDQLATASSTASVPRSTLPSNLLMSDRRC